MFGHIVDIHEKSINTHLNVCIHKYKYSYNCMYTQIYLDVNTNINILINVCIHKYKDSYNCTYNHS